MLVLFRRVNLPGWRFEEVVFLYGFSLIPFGLFNILSLNLYEFGNTYIMEGKFDRVLLRPVNSLFQVLFENFRIESFFEAFTGVGIVIWMAVRIARCTGMSRMCCCWSYSAFAVELFTFPFSFCSAHFHSGLKTASASIRRSGICWRSAAIPCPFIPATFSFF